MTAPHAAPLTGGGVAAPRAVIEREGHGNRREDRVYVLRIDGRYVGTYETKAGARYAAEQAGAEVTK